VKATPGIVFDRRRFRGLEVVFYGLFQRFRMRSCGAACSKSRRGWIDNG